MVTTVSPVSGPLAGYTPVKVRGGWKVKMISVDVSDWNTPTLFSTLTYSRNAPLKSVGARQVMKGED
eukprot:CAMPEP_0113907842 /NCGR_PEP_ID=MMETSP0780_2-20120614/25754_1 /TAXON_ID=652834 /ORGANISM="Palpitomonas bilix" /LENGTH=66 /DNA_ID=CAMNT_0000903051 /DNA_START=184 /DNA_END=381 /DNA_ORIENTATION=+ /assembly_acc=CAM_ASM_000599